MAFNKVKALQEAEKLVTQGKIALAIKQYQEIAENDPADLNLLNTIGDLYVRERNISKALEQFKKIVVAYVREGFTVKAIAMYKKISKLDPTVVEPVLKLAELYQAQGLTREAREQYTLGVDFYRKRGQNDKALDILRTIVRLDPENTTFRLHLGEFCEKAGFKEDAAKTYLETAEIAARRKDPATAENAIKKAAGLSPHNPRIRLLEAQLALSRQQPAKAEKIISSDAALKKLPEGRRLLLEAYLASQKLEAAQSLVSDVYRSNPSDFSPLSAFAALCFEKGNYDAAFQPLLAAADELIEQGNTTPLMECLRRIWQKRPHDIPLIELMCRVGERSADEVSVPEMLEALGHAYVQAGELEKAELTYRKLTEHEPDNDGHRGLLKQVLQKLGKDVVVPSPELAEVALSEPESPLAPPAPVDADEAAAVKEAIENSDLYYRYGSVDKALAELEKILADYPDQVDIHKRIVEVCQRKRPERAAAAQQRLALIYAQRGDQAKAKKYEEMARQGGAARPAPAPANPDLVPSVTLATAPEAGGVTPSAPSPTPPPPEPQPTAPPQSIPLEANPASSRSGTQEPEAEAAEVDLSSDLDAMMAPLEDVKAQPEAQPPPSAPAFDYEESKVEVTFYLENGFLEEAQKVVDDLKRRFPDNTQVTELNQLVENHVIAARETRASTPPPPTPAPAEEPAEIVFAEAQAEENPPPSERAEPLRPPPPPEPPPSPLPITPSAGAGSPSAAPSGTGEDLLGGLANDLAASLEGLDATTPPPPQPPPSPPRSTPKPVKAKAGASASPLDGLLDELHELAGQQAEEGDSETHYSLGVAFREMGLLDEAIGEFQKVVKGAQKGKLPPNFLQACTLLAICFMDKKMPGIATRWYLRALETPGLDDDAMLALQYDLGVAYEQAGDTRTALERFTEVYSQNIDFRDVAEKIRQLQQKVS